ncbi:hypothetical protein RIF23_20195 [Lipingzhangella sp. LS1_29]|uniref:Uncharacterized protein n=1 Tax=Lipingzhangella rawalii TaxID=2055835 RepID=A0ABU2HC85_9ACTN|nr:hypothetical protein [Lipingzhangella rawalii]MDS1272612.1 hypothetical protein [Lipingzhangella rawalii]
MNNVTTETPILDYLRAVDREHADAFEFPINFDWHEAEERIDELTERLGAVHPYPAAVAWVQDATYHAAVTLPTESGTRLMIRASNFAALAAVEPADTREYPTLDEAVAGGAVTEEERRRVLDAVAHAEYVHVPEHVLDHPYDGVYTLREIHPGKPPTWRIRFFGQL